jgi:hypothetical protein
VPYVAAYIIVTNDAWYDADVYAYNSGQRIRIGLVRSGATTVLPVRVGLFPQGRAKLCVRRLDGQAAFLTDEVTVGDGGRAVLHIAQALDQSTLTPEP